VQIGAGGEQLVGQPGLAGTCTEERLGQGDERGVLEPGRGWAWQLRRRLGRAPAPSLHSFEQFLAPSAHWSPPDASNPLEL
jgi:hypothetical protein